MLCPLNRGLVGLPSLSGRFGGEINIILAGIRTLNYAAPSPLIYRLSGILETKLSMNINKLLQCQQMHSSIMFSTFN